MKCESGAGGRRRVDADHEAHSVPHTERWPAKTDATGMHQQLPGQAKPSQAKPSQAKPSQAKPSQAEPSQAKPRQAEPSQGKPSQATPSHAKPSQALIDTFTQQSGAPHSEPLRTIRRAEARRRATGRLRI